MLDLDLGAINYWAVLVAAIVAFMIGGLWYGLLFSKAWVAANGFSESQVQAMASKQVRNFGIFIVAEAIMALVISILAVNLQIDSALGGAMLGGLLWLGLAATIGAEKKAANLKSPSVWMIDTSHELAVLVAMGLIIGWW